MNTLKTLAATMALVVVGAGVSYAETTAAPAPAKPAISKPVQVSAAKPKKNSHLVAARTEASKACSAQADAQNLHGQARREFRKSCLKTAAAKAKPAMVKTAAVKPAAPAQPTAAAKPASDAKAQ